MGRREERFIWISMIAVCFVFLLVYFISIQNKNFLKVRDTLSYFDSLDQKKDSSVKEDYKKYFLEPFGSAWAFFNLFGLTLIAVILLYFKIRDNFFSEKEKNSEEKKFIKDSYLTFRCNTMFLYIEDFLKKFFLKNYYGIDEKFESQFSELLEREKELNKKVDVKSFEEKKQEFFNNTNLGVREKKEKIQEEQETFSENEKKLLAVQMIILKRNKRKQDAIHKVKKVVTKDYLFALLEIIFKSKSNNYGIFDNKEFCRELFIKSMEGKYVEMLPDLLKKENNEKVFLNEKGKLHGEKQKSIEKLKEIIKEKEENENEEINLNFFDKSFFSSDEMKKVEKRRNFIDQKIKKYHEMLNERNGKKIEKEQNEELEQEIEEQKKLLEKNKKL